MAGIGEITLWDFQHSQGGVGQRMCETCPYSFPTPNPQIIPSSALIFDNQSNKYSVW